ARDGATRIDSRPSPAGIHGSALQHTPPRLPYAVFDRRLGPLLGNAPMGHEFPAQRGRSRGDALLAFAPLRTDHLFTEVSSRANERAGSDRLSGGPCGSR